MPIITRIFFLLTSLARRDINVICQVKIKKKLLFSKNEVY